MVNDNKPYPAPEERAEAEQSTQELIAAQGQVPGTGRAEIRNDKYARQIGYAPEPSSALHHSRLTSMTSGAPPGPSAQSSGRRPRSGVIGRVRAACRQLLPSGLAGTDGSVTASCDFDIEYYGTALESHELDFRDLVPALLSMGDLFRTIDRQLNHTEPGVQVTIRAAGDGSFHTQLTMPHGTYANDVGSPAPQGTEGLAWLLTVFTGLANYLLRRHRSGEPLRPPSQIGNGMALIEWPDDPALEVPEVVLRLAEDAAIRHSLSRLVTPLGLPGVNALRVLLDQLVLLEVRSEEVSAFAGHGAPSRDVLSTNERVVCLSILVSSWQVGRKWLFSDGHLSFWATITEDLFNQRLASGARFGSHDVLRCRVLETQWRDALGAHTDIAVVEVLEQTEVVSR